MTDDSEVARIAARLSKAQRVALLWLPDDGSLRVHGKGDPRDVSLWAMSNVLHGDPREEIASQYRLCERSDGPKRPGRIWPDSQWSATPLGIAVRAYLQSKGGDT